MSADGTEAFFLTLAFVVPGFVMNSAIAMSVPQSVKPPHLTFLRFLALSCTNYAVWSWLVYLIIRAPLFTERPGLSAIAWGWIVLVGPGMIGLLLGGLQSRDHVRHVLHKLGLSPIHSIPTSWDWKFSRTISPVWMLVTLKNGGVVRGLFGSRSFASSEPGERDLYLQQLYHLEGDRWSPMPRTDGVLVAGDEIRHIEFILDQESADDREENQRPER